LVISEPERYWERALKETAHVIVTRAACLKKGRDALVICGPHNKVLAQYIMLEAQRVGSQPFLWEFNEDFFRESFERASGNSMSSVLGQMRSLVEKSDTIIWLSQFENVERFPANIRKAIYSFWNAISEAVKLKPCLFVNLPSPRTVRTIGINYLEFLSAFINGIKVDYKKIKETGLDLASVLSGKKLIRVSHANGTDLEFSVKDRHLSVESGTLEDCYFTGRDCGIDVPAGEIYITPIETSANGILVVNEHKEYGLKKLELRFADGRITGIKAERGGEPFRKLMEKAEGDKDKIGEFGMGTNYGIKPVGWSIYDEKAIGTAHVAIGNHFHLGGANEASIHIDFVLNKPTIEVDGKAIMGKGRFLRQRRRSSSKA
jgi:leucyl aminopeptidase (aminopeptidase T)